VTNLSEVARHIVVPEGITSSGWPAVEAKCREFGDRFDEWQSGAGRLILAKRADGSYAATVGGITLSIPRQVAKTFLVSRIIFALCVIFPGLKVLWTAHRTRTATNTFKGLQGYCKRPSVAPHVSDIRTTNGEQEIRFANGSVIMFGARETGFGRGFDEVDVEVFDEAQILGLKALEDMVAATNQSRHEHGALLFYMGTPPRPVDNGEVFKARRDEALAFTRPDGDFTGVVVGDDSLYIECSADRGADPDDRAQWAKANPSYPHRTPLRSMLRLRKNLPDVDSWAREALGIWDAVSTDTQPIDPERWALFVDGESMATDETLTLALDAPIGRKSACFSVAGRRVDRLRHVAIRYWVPPQRIGEVVSIARQLCEGHRTKLYMPPNSPALAWRDDLRAAGVEVVEVKAAAFIEAQQVIEQAVADGGIRHRGQPDMDAAVRGLAGRANGDRSPWSRRSSSTNTSPLFAAAAAVAAGAEPRVRRTSAYEDGGLVTV
jgi:phage terminase large subunit-like protein